MCILSCYPHLLISLSCLFPHRSAVKPLKFKKKKKVYTIVFKGSKDGGAREIRMFRFPRPIHRPGLLQERREQASPRELAKGGNEKSGKIRRAFGAQQ